MFGDLCVLPAASADTITYGYDSLGRLISLADSSGTVTTYGLDAAGNRLSVVTTLDTPTGLQATAVSQTQINLQWIAPASSTGSPIIGYYIYRNGSQVGATSATSYSDTGLSGYTTYTYAVASYDAATPPHFSAQSLPVSALTPDTTAPSIPANLATGTLSQTSIPLTWSGSTDTGGSGLAGYYIYRKDQGTNPIATATGTSYTNTGLAGYTSYTYTVAAFDHVGNLSAASTAVNATTPDQTPPSVPTGLSTVVISQTQINVSWAASADTGGSGLAGYKIYRADQGTTPIATTATTSYSNTGLTANTAYTYSVASYDNAGNNSAVSASASGTTLGSVPTTPGTPGPAGIVSSSPWSEGWAGSQGNLAYYVLSKTNGTTVTTVNVTAPATTYSETGGNGITYTFQVKACNSSNQCSSFSAASSVTYCSKGVCP